MTPQKKLPAPRTDWAFFFDVDGTILEIAPTPDAVVVGERVLEVLRNLGEVSDGAVALVSGRPLDQLDRLFAPLRLPTAGLHGLEVRIANGDVLRPPEPSRDFGHMRETLRSFAAHHAGLLFEDKGYALALHYRMAAEFEEASRNCVEEAFRRWGNGYQILVGRKVFEIKPSEANKGKVVETLMTTTPFSGRCPVYVGDDVTDEDGFTAVNRLGGHSIHVGATDKTAARYTVAGVSELLDWLSEAAQWISTLMKEV